MATGNFYSESGKYYAVLMNYERPILDDDGNETEETETVSPESYEYDDEISYIQERFAEYAKNTPFVEFNESDQYLNDRNFGGRIFGTLSMSKQYAGIWIEVHYQLIMRSGYYEGANLDYEYSFYTDSVEIEDITDVAFEYMQQLDYSNGHYNKPTGFATIQSKHAMAWLTKAFAQLDEAINKIYSECSTPLVVTARFSNGETWYQKKDDRLTDES